LTKKISSSFCHALAYLPQEYERNQIFDPCREIKNLSDFYRQALLICLLDSFFCLHEGSICIVTFSLRAHLNTAQYGHPDNTDTLACPLGVRINGVPLYMHNTQITKDLDMLTKRESEIIHIWPCAAISTVVHFSIARYIFVMIVFVCCAKLE